MRRIWLLLIPTAFLTACASTPAPLKGQYADTTPQQVHGNVDAYVGRHVRWGGDIASVKPGQNSTCVTVLARPLDGEARPKDTDQTLGRFIACSSGFYDPAVYAQKREVTVVGTIAGSKTEKIGDYDYTYPEVTADNIYLWPKRPQFNGAYPYYYPYGMYYSPYSSPFFGPFGGGFGTPYCGLHYRPWGCGPYWW